MRVLSVAQHEELVRQVILQVFGQLSGGCHPILPSILDGGKTPLNKQGYGSAIDGGPAPYLDCRPIAADEKAAVADAITAPWLSGGVEDRALGYAIAELVPAHLAEVKQHRLVEIDRHGSLSAMLLSLLALCSSSTPAIPIPPRRCRPYHLRRIDEDWAKS
jgi:hypothetical protein